MGSGFRGNDRRRGQEDVDLPPSHPAAPAQSVAWSEAAGARAEAEAAWAEAEAARQRAELLAQASDVLAQSLDYPTTLRQVGRLVVQSLASYCTIDLLTEDGGLERLLATSGDPHDPRMETLAAHPPRRDTPHPAWQVLQTGQPILLPELSEAANAALPTVAADAVHLDLLERMQLRALLVVPLQARGRMLGTLQMLWSADHTLVQAGTLARGGGAQADLLVMARALADRAAVAIDNARLHSELQAAMRAREAFFAAVSHDLKNPLTTIGLWTEQLQLLYTPRDETEGRRVFEQALDRIHAAVGRSIGLIEEVLDVARLSTGEPLHLQRASVDLVHLTREVVHEQAVLEARAVRLEARARALRGRWDPARLRRVLDNLLSNAHKYSPHGREVVIRLTRDDTSPAPAALLTVQDEGIGIPATDLPHIFERFYRATNVHDFIQGSGLGLWGARHIVEQHGGTLTLQSQEGVGTTVAVRLPLSRAARKRSPAGTASRR